MSYQAFLQARERLALGVRAGSPPQDAGTVAANPLLTLAQLEAVRQLQDGMQALATLQASLNGLMALHRLPLTGLCLPQLGLLQHQLQGLLFEHQRAVAKLALDTAPAAAGGAVLPLHRAA